MIGVVAALMLVCDIALLAYWTSRSDRAALINYVLGYGLVNGAILLWLGWQCGKYEAGKLRCDCGGDIYAHTYDITGAVIGGRCNRCLLVHPVVPVTQEEP